MIKSVPDTNVLISAEHGNLNSPNREYFERWKKSEFFLLFSDDTLKEYIKKLDDFGFTDYEVAEAIAPILSLGIHVDIVHFHYKKYPTDQDDIAFILCADNGEATHLVSYDKHLLDLNGQFDFKICQTLEFLSDLRNSLEDND